MTDDDSDPLEPLDNLSADIKEDAAMPEGDVDGDVMDDIEDEDVTLGVQAANTIRHVIYVIAKLTGLVIFDFFKALSRPIPKLNQRIWGGITKRALHTYHKSAGGDRLGIVMMPSGSIKLVPVKYRTVHDVDEDEKPGWKAKGTDKTWKPTTDDATGRLGKTPIITLDAESWRATSVLEARVAEAVDQGDHRPLYRVDEAEMTATVDMNGAPGGGQQAVADGGLGIQNIEFDPRGSPIFEDEIIDLGSEDYDGQAVSFAKARELWLEQTSTEEMSMQEERGFLAGRSRKDMKRWALKILIIAGLIALGGLIGPELVDAVFASGGGGDGGGGGGMGIPLMLPLLG